MNHQHPAARRIRDDQDRFGRDESARLAHVFGFSDDEVDDEGAPRVRDLIGTAVPAVAQADDEPEPEPEPGDLAPEPDPEPRAEVLQLVPRRAFSPQVRATLEQQDIVVTPAVVPEADSLVARAKTMLVTDAGSWQAAIDVFDQLRTVEQEIHAYFDEDCALAHKLWKNQTDKRGAQLKPVEDERKALGDRAAAWKADDDRRIEREAHDTEQQIRQEQDKAAAREVKQLVAQGELAEAEQLLREAKTAPTPFVPRRASVGSSKALTRKKWKGRITDWPTLRAAIGRGEFPEFDEALQLAVQPGLDGQAPTLKTELGKRYPGTEGYEQPTTAGR